MAKFHPKNLSAVSELASEDMDVHKTLSAGEAPPRLGEAKALHFSVGWAQHAHMLKCHSSADTW